MSEQTNEQMSEQVSVQVGKRKKILTRVLCTLSFIMLLAMAVMAYMLNYTELDTVIGTGTIDINLNDGVVIFNDDDLDLQPGESVMRGFFIENVGTEDFYYRIYLEEVSGELVETTQFNIYDGEGTLLETVETVDFNSTHYFTTDEIIEVGERLDFKIEIVFIDDSGDSYQDAQLSFDIVASAIQSKNNE